MNRFRLPLFLISVLALFILSFSCSNEASTKPNFIFKPAPQKGLVGKIADKEITKEQLQKGIESEIYDLESKLYELKLNQLKAIILKEMINSASDKGSMSVDQYIDQKITKNVKPTQKEIDTFVKERKIPKEHLNDQLKKRISDFLSNELKKKAVDKWLAAKTKKTSVEIYLDQPERPFFDVKVGDAPTIGGKNSKVTLIEFSDFECPFCAKGAEVLKQVKKKYGDKVEVAFKHFPLPFHKKARGAAMASMCANEQSSKYFWKMHYLMFENQSSLDEAGLKSLAKKAGVDLDKFTQCVASNKYASFVESNINEGRNIGVKSTPTFFINGRLINGAQAFEVFEAEINKHL